MMLELKINSTKNQKDPKIIHRKLCKSMNISKNNY